MFFSKKILHASVCILTLLVLVSCSPEKNEVAEVKAVRPVKLITTDQANVTQTRRYPAAIKAALSKELSFNVSGLIRELLVKESQKISKGEIIAQLDQRDFQNRAESAAARYETAEREYQRGLRLQQGDAISRSDLERRKSQMEIAKAELSIAQKALNDTVLTAPFSGKIAKVPVKNLQNVQAGEPIVTLFEENRLQATINFPANLLATSLQRKEEKSFIIFEAVPGQRIPAVFQEAKLEADIVSQTFAVTLTFEPPPHLIILPGMNAIVEIVSPQSESEEQKHGVTVPLGAILSTGDALYVWVVNMDTMRVSKRQVTVLDSVGETLVVTDGLAAGETIAGAGAAYLTEGMKVRPWSMQ